MRYEDENIWLTQKMMAVPHDVSVPAINQHLKRIYDDSELRRPRDRPLATPSGTGVPSKALRLFLKASDS